jgi:diguanylate cyclase (GGDEF)-like protein/PAS domain S-box-containing protein
VTSAPWAALSLLLALILAGACWPGRAEAQAETQEAPPIVVACPDDAPPYSYRDADGEPAGILPEYWRLLARSSGRQVDLRLAPGAEALRMVELGQADAHAGTQLPDDPGKPGGERFAWSRPLLDMGVGIFATSEQAALVDQNAGGRLESARLTAGLVAGDSAGTFLAAAFPHLRQQEYPSLDALAAALALGQVRVAAGPLLALRHRLRQLGQPERFVLLRRFPGAALRAAVRKDDQALLAFLNVGIEGLDQTQVRTLEQRHSLGSFLMQPWTWGAAAGLVFLAASVLVLLRARRLRRDAEARGREADLLRESLLAEMSRHRQTQDLLALAIEQSPVGIIIANEDRSKPLVFNSEALRILGLESVPAVKDFLRGMPWRMYSATGRYVPFEEQPLVAAVRRGEVTSGAEFRLVFSDGTERWAVANAAPVRDAQGRVCAGIVVFQDTTQVRQAERELARFKFFIDAGVEEVYLVRPGGTVAYVNEAVARSLGHPRQELLETPLSTIDPAFTPEEVFRLHQRVRQSPQTFETMQYSRDGKPLLKEINAFYMRFGDEEFICAFGRDITERRRLERELERTRVLFRAALEQAPWGIIIGDAATGRVSIANPAAAQMLGVEPGALIGMEVNGHLPIWRFEDEAGQIVTPGETPLSRALTTGEATRDQEVRFFISDGPERWILANASPIRAADGGSMAGIMVMADITARKRMENQLVFKALHDSLTGLPNRALCLERIQQALERSRREGLPFAVAFADLDRFKMLNDSLGHSFGDQVLVEASRRLAQALEDKGSVCRFGGDEFVLLVDRAQDESEAQDLLHDALEALCQPMSVEGQEVRLTASVGVVLGPPDDDTNAENVLQNADLAMHRAKDTGRDRIRLFHPGMLRRAQELMSLDADLRRGLERGEFIVYYQPIMSADGGRMLGVEALARWQSPTRGLVTPHAFIAHAEDSGLIVPLGEQVLRLACREMTALRKRYAAARRLTLAVNLSARQFAQPDIVNTVRQVLRETGLPPALLKLELTESTLMGDPEGALSAMRRLKALGVSLAIDDFGTGYSSLAYLQRFPVDLLKIDRSFVRDLPREDADSRALVGAIAALAGSLRLSIVAEGVETREQLDLLVGLGCEAVQGYFFHPPLPEAELARLLEAAEERED